MLGDACFVGGIRDPDFKPYRIIIVLPGLFEIPSWQLCFATLLAKILRGVWGDPVSNDTNSSDKACSMNQEHLPTLALRCPKELLSRRCQPHIHNIDPKPNKRKQAYMPLRCASALAETAEAASHQSPQAVLNRFWSSVSPPRSGCTFLDNAQ